MLDHLADRLRIKYGLTNNPDEAAIARWAEQVSTAVQAGEHPDSAGRRAALEVFGELDGILYFSEADTIEALLAAAKAK